MNSYNFDKTSTDLFRAILNLKTVGEAEKFFRDLCTAEELDELGERWQIAKLLSGGVSYRDIAQKLKVSTTTVSRVAAWLNNGAGGYNLILKRLNGHHRNSVSTG